MEHWQRKHLLGLKDLTRSEIELVLDSAKSFKEISQRQVKKVPALRGKTVVNLFFEPSTRTRTSFELAAKRLSADVINFSSSASSMVKGESILDTLKNLEAYSVDIFVVRHEFSTSALYLSEHTKASVVNAGDGQDEHPTQALLDMFTLKEKLGRLERLKVSVIGDIIHSRVARSNVWGLSKAGAEVTLCGPKTLLPKYSERFPCKVTDSVKEALKSADAVIMLRIQEERMGRQLISSQREYVRYFSLNKENVKYLSPESVVMHPGPVNWDAEIASCLKEKIQPLILTQVTNGLAVRMAVLYLLSEGKKYEITD